MPGSYGNSDDNSIAEIPGVCTSRSGRAIRTHDYENQFHETAHFQQDEISDDDAYLKPYFSDDYYCTRKLVKRMFYRNSCFSGCVTVSKENVTVDDNIIKHWNDAYQ